MFPSHRFPCVNPPETGESLGVYLSSFCRRLPGIEMEDSAQDPSSLMGRLFHGELPEHEDIWNWDLTNIYPCSMFIYIYIYI